MALGRKKKKQEAGENPAGTEESQASAAAPTGSRKKSNETLSSVVNESAPGAAVDLLKQNAAFALPGGKAWVALLLSADDIGGLSIKQKNDPAKGSIIELIRADKIEVVVTADMLADDFLGIVPTPGTLSRMDEYSLLTGARYYWVVFESESNGSLQALPVDGIKATYQDALAVSRGEKTLADVVPPVWQHYGGDASAAAPVAEEPVAAASADDEDPLAAALPSEEDQSGAAAVDEDFDYGALADDEPAGADEDDEPVGDDFSVYNDEQEPYTGNGFDDEDEDAVFAPDDDEDQGDAYQEYVDANMGRNVTEEEVRDTIARRFLAGDLDLVVDLDEFERTFQADGPAIQIEVAEDPSDWLGSQVAQLTRQANADLESLHYSHAQELRELYVETMSIHAQRVVEQVSTTAEGSEFHGYMEAARQAFESERSNSARTLAETRADIQRRFDEAAEVRAEQAAAHARAQYSDKNRPKLERDMADAQIDLDRRIEEHFAQSQLVILDARRKDAIARMDLGLTQVFRLLREKQEQQRADERDLLARWNDELTRFIDENRKNDVARANALAEQLARENQVEALRVEHAARIQQLQIEQEEARRQNSEDLIRIRQEAVEQLNANQAQFNTSLTLEQERTRSQQALVAQLTEQIGKISEETEKHHQARIANLEEDKRSYEAQLDLNNRIQRRANQTVVVLIVVLVLAALAVGALLGQWWGVTQVNADGAALLGTYLFPESLAGPAAAGS